jgi:DNA-binding protein HU-beta
MTKAKLVDLVSKKSGVSKKNTNEVINIFFDELSSLLENGDKYNALGFGTFCVIQKPERIALIPKTTTKITVPAKKIAKFKPGKILKDKLLK